MIGSTPFRIDWLFDAYLMDMLREGAAPAACALVLIDV